MLFKFATLFSYFHLVHSTHVYNYYELSVQKWCSSDYMIHGLWPQINSTSYPENCEKVSYVTPIGDLLDDMNMYWHSCDNTLWEHEWEKHGSCTGLTEVEYFQKALDCFEKVKANGKEWVQQRSNKIPFDLNFQIVSELDFLPN